MLNIIRKNPDLSRGRKNRKIKLIPVTTNLFAYGGGSFASGAVRDMAITA